MNNSNRIKEFFILSGAVFLYVFVDLYEKYLTKFFQKETYDAGDELEQK